MFSKKGSSGQFIVPFYNRMMHVKGSDGIANSVNPNLDSSQRKNELRVTWNLVGRHFYDNIYA